MSSQSFTATTKNALTSAKNVCTSGLKLEGPETWDPWYETISNVMKETMTGASSGTFKNMSVWDSIMSSERRDEQQHEASQRFAQQLLTASISSANFDVIKSIPKEDPDDEDNESYNRARLQILALQEDHASSSTATLSMLIAQLRKMKIEHFKKKGMKDSRALVLFFQAHTNTVTRINAIAEHRQNEAQLLYNIQSNLPARFMACARGSKTVEQLKRDLIHEANMYTDGVDSEEQAFTTVKGDQATKNQNKTTRPKSPGSSKRTDCFDWTKRGYCRFGGQCKFEHGPSSFQWQPSYRQESRIQHRQHRNFSEGGQGNRGGWNARPRGLVRFGSRGRGGYSGRGSFRGSGRGRGTRGGAFGGNHSVNFHDYENQSWYDESAMAGGGQDHEDENQNREVELYDECGRSEDRFEVSRGQGSDIFH